MRTRRSAVCSTALHTGGSRWHACYFVAPRETSTTLTHLLANPGKLKAQLIAAWDKSVRDNISATPTPLTGKFAEYVDAFDYSTFQPLALREVLEGHGRLRGSFADHLGQGPICAEPRYHWQHEPCWYAARGSATWHGDRKQSTLWQIPARDDAGHGHGTQKPVECMRRPIENNSSPGQAVYEPFCGSGTTIIAAEITGRSCHAIELMPQYVDVAIERWQAFTGEDAKLEDHGRTFAEAARERQGSMPGKDALFAKEKTNGASEQTRDGEQQQSPID